MTLAQFLAAPPESLTYLDYVAAQRAAEKSPPAGTPLRVAVLRNVTVETMLPVIAGELLRSGFVPALHLGDFDAIASETLAPGAALYAFRPDLILVCQWLETLSPRLAGRFTSLRPDDVETEIARVVGGVRTVATAIRRETGAPLLINDFPLPAHPTLGILDAQQAHGQTAAVLDLNARLRGLAASLPDTYLLSLMRASAQIGHNEFFDAKQWQIARSPFARRAQIAIARDIAAFARALHGKTKKCLVLDCDNTLWGGVIGEDGIEGIQIGETYPGSVYQSLQREVLNLHDRGVIVALASKNDESEVLTVLREHPGMLLREEHLATWAIDWNDKPANLRRIAKTLNIGLDSLVFVDDNPFEVEFVRAELPEVTTVLLPADRARFASALAGTGLFDALTFTAEDRARTASYKANAERAQLEASATNIEEYLSSLGIVLTFGPPSDIEIARVAQLSQKTNQFNLTTRRYTEDQVRALRDGPDTRVFAMRARDKVAELGLVGAAVLRRHGAVAEIESLFVSCRALGRGLENAFLASAVNELFASGVRRFVGRRIATPKNALCEAFYEQAGFAAAGAEAGVTTWALDASEPMIVPPWVSVETAAGVEAMSR